MRAITRFTPGPWEADRAKADEGGHYYQIDGPQLVGNMPYTVCDTLNRHACISPDEDAANAHLIAAAPEMYSALKAALEELPQFPTADCAYEKAKVALAKAEGREVPA